PKEVSALIRTGLFAFTTTPADVTNEMVGWIEGEAQRYIHERLGDSTDEFDRSVIQDKKGDLIGRIARRRRTPFGPMSRDLVNSAFVEIGWRATQSVGHCFDALMRAFRDTLDEPPNPWERERFELMFLRQPCFADLPLVMIRQRVGFLHFALLDMLEDP